LTGAELENLKIVSKQKKETEKVPQQMWRKLMGKCQQKKSIQNGKTTAIVAAHTILEVPPSLFVSVRFILRRFRAASMSNAISRKEAGVGLWLGWWRVESGWLG